MEQFPAKFVAKRSNRFEEEEDRNSRFLRTQHEKPKRPTSPHLALGHRQPPQPPTFKDNVSSEERKRTQRQYEKEKRAYIKERGDQLERLVKVVFVQILTH